MSFEFWAVGRTVSHLTLKKQFGNEYQRVLGDLLELLPKKTEREHNKYKVVGEMPKLQTEYQKLFNEHFSTDVESLIGGAYSEIEELANEMREAFDNMPEQLRDGDIGQRRSDAADALDSIVGDIPDIPEYCVNIMTVFVPGRGLTSRRKRADEASRSLQDAASEIREFISNFDEEQEEIAAVGKELLHADPKEYTDPETAPDMNELESLADDLEQAAEELDEIDFPGMYG